MRCFGSDYASGFYEVMMGIVLRIAKRVHFSLWQNRDIHDPTSLLLRDGDDDEVGQPCVFRGDGRSRVRVMIFREVDRKNENSNKCLGPLCRSYTEAWYAPLLQRSNSRDRPAHARNLRGIFSQWRFYELFMWGHSSRAKYVAEFRSLRQDLRKMRHTCTNVIVMNLFCF